MTYTPSRQTNNVPDLRDMHFSMYQLLTDIFAYYDTLTSSDPLYSFAMQKAKVVFGFSEEELVELSNSSNDTRSLISLYYDDLDTANISLPYQSGRQIDTSFRLPYNIYIRTLSTSDATLDYALAHEYMRINKIITELDKALTNDGYTQTIAPNTIEYNGVAQTSLSEKEVAINCGSNSIIGVPILRQETLNNRQFRVGIRKYAIHFKQQNI